MTIYLYNDWCTHVYCTCWSYQDYAPAVWVTLRWLVTIPSHMYMHQKHSVFVLLVFSPNLHSSVTCSWISLTDMLTSLLMISIGKGPGKNATAFIRFLSRPTSRSHKQDKTVRPNNLFLLIRDFFKGNWFLVLLQINTLKNTLAFE